MAAPPPSRRTKIVATLGPASNSPEVLRALIQAGMDVARLNFSHGRHEDHAAVVALLRSISRELDTPVTILQDLQGPKVRVGQLPGNQLELPDGASVSIVPEAAFRGESATVPIDFPGAAQEVRPGMSILLADGLLALEVQSVDGAAVRCRVVEGGVLESRKGVNFPEVSLPLPSLTPKDIADVEFGVAQGVDWISLSFVRSAADVLSLKQLLQARSASIPVMAKIEKPQALERLAEIVQAADGIMVARGDLGVEMRPEKVPMAQKRIIELCNREGVPVITATQMLESMVHEPRPTRAEASDVANAILDGTDAVMLSAESAIGKFPVPAVEMMARIAREVEARLAPRAPLAEEQNDARWLSEAAGVVARGARIRCIAVITTSGYTARFAAAQRPPALIVALTPEPAVYHSLNLFWGLRPVLVVERPADYDGLVSLAERVLLERKLAEPGEKILVVGGTPPGQPRGSNFLKIHELRN